MALCGKGVVYNSNGLSLKPKTGMPGMKYDIGESAGVLGKFQVPVRLWVPRRLSAILDIVKSSIGPTAVRNNDILTMKSARTVEVNNTDAGG